MPTDRLVRLDDVLQAFRSIFREPGYTDQFTAAFEAALVALPEAPQWQPIETANKQEVVLGAWWDEAEGAWRRDCARCYTDCYDESEHWLCSGGGTPVLWMPLPPKPPVPAKGLDG